MSGSGLRAEVAQPRFGLSIGPDLSFAFCDLGVEGSPKVLFELGQRTLDVERTRPGGSSVVAKGAVWASEI